MQEAEVRYFKPFWFLGLILPSQDKTYIFSFINTSLVSLFYPKEDELCYILINWCLMQLEIVFLLLCASFQHIIHITIIPKIPVFPREGILSNPFCLPPGLSHDSCTLAQWIDSKHTTRMSVCLCEDGFSVHSKLRLSSQIHCKLCLLIVPTQPLLPQQRIKTYVENWMRWWFPVWLSELPF